MRPLRRLLRQFGDKPLIFRFGPEFGHTSANTAKRTKQQRKFGDVVAVRRIDDKHNVAVARCQEKLLNFNPDLLCEFAAGPCAFRGFLTARIP